MGTRLRRVSDDLWQEVEKVYRRNKGMIPKTTITKQFASQIRQMNRKNPKLIVNYWPISRKKVKIY